MDASVQLICFLQLSIQMPVYSVISYLYHWLLQHHERVLLYNLSLTSQNPMKRKQSTQLQEATSQNKSTTQHFIVSENPFHNKLHYIKLTTTIIHSNRSENKVEPTLHSVPAERQNTYLIFEASLLVLFSSCMFCRSCSTKIRKFTIGSFVRIIQWCNNCKTKRVWESQPYLGDIPAGNILSSSIAIQRKLYSLSSCW